MNRKFICILSLTVALLLALSSIVPVTAQSSGGSSNPSVIPGSSAALNGPRVSTLIYPIYTSNDQSYAAMVAGQQNVMDYPPTAAQIADAQTHNYLNLTSGAGGDEEFVYFNECDGMCPQGNINPSDPANQYNASIPGASLIRATSANVYFRRAFAQLVNYTYAQDVVEGDTGIATQNLLLPQAYGAFSDANIVTYAFSYSGANATLAKDPYVAWAPASKAASATNIGSVSEYQGAQCKPATTGAWEYSTSPGSGTPNGTLVLPVLISRTNHPTWLTMGHRIYADAGVIGLCLVERDFSTYSSVAPVVFDQYSTGWQMYFGGVGFSAPLNPITDFFYAYTANPGWDSSSAFNVDHAYNSTLEALLQDAFVTNNITQAEADISQADFIMSQNVYQLNMWWDTTIIPTLNNYNGVDWSGYVNTPAYSTWSFATGFWSLLNAHMVNPNNGSTITGGTFKVGVLENPDDVDDLQARSTYDFDAIAGIYDSPVTSGPGNPTLGGLIPWAVTSMPVATPYSGKTPHGYNVVNGQKIVLNFLNNITFTDNVPMTAADYNFSLWYVNYNGASTDGGVVNSTFPFAGGCSAPCWAPYAGNQPADFFAGFPALTDSVVNSTYSMTVYVNGTGLSNYVFAVDTVILPEHLWSQVNSATLNNDFSSVGGIQNYNVNGESLMTGTGPFVWGTWVQNQYIEQYRNPGYFRSDIQDWSLNAGSSGSVALNIPITQLGGNSSTSPVPIPTTATVQANVQKGGSPTGVSTTLTSGGNGWQGTLNTASLSQGFYEIVVNATYTSGGLNHEALQFWGLNVGPSSVSSTSITATGQSTTSTASPSSTTLTSQLPTTTTSTSSSSLTLPVIGGIVAVIIIVVVAAVLVMRRRGPT